MAAGLGNPGEDYSGTRHNVGFMVIDAVLAVFGDRFGTDHYRDSFVHTVRYAGTALRLVKPLTFMNSSGTAVAGVARKHDLLPEEVLVIHDCVDLPLGRIRLRQTGSSGGHRGVDSVIEELGTHAFPRLRIGVGRPEGETVDYVLAEWRPEELPVVHRVIDVSAEAVLFTARHGLDAAMNKYNGWSLTDAAPQDGAADKENGN